MKLRKLIRNLISENVMLNNNDHIDQLFNYYTSKKEQEETNFNFKITSRKFGDKVIDELIHIIMNEEGVSEKSFSTVDEVVERSKNLVLTNKEYIFIIADDQNCRPQLPAEKIFQLYKASK